MLNVKMPYTQVILSALRHPENSLAFLGIELSLNTMYSMQKKFRVIAMTWMGMAGIAANLMLLYNKWTLDLLF